MNDLQRRIKGLEGEINHCQREHEDRIKDQGKQITHLEGDIDSLKKTIKDKGEEGI